MSNESDRPQSRMVRYTVTLAVVIVSLATTVGLFCWHLTQEMANGNVPKEQRYFEGSLKDGELWYRVHRSSGNPFSPQMTTRLMRLNLETGEERETSLKFTENYLIPVWIEDVLYVYAQDAKYQTVIYQIVDETSVKLAPVPSGRSLTVPFLFDGKLTVAYDEARSNGDSNDRVRLAHWIDGKWVDGRQFTLPSYTQYWFDDPERGRKVLLPRTSVFTGTFVKSSTSYYFPYALQVAYFQGQFHLMTASPSLISPAYRKGFEFVDEFDTECPSAIAAENAPPEATGWSPILDDQAFVSWVQLASDQNGLLFCSTGEPNRIVGQNKDGSRKELKIAGNSRSSDESTPWIAAQRDVSPAYVVYGNSFWGTASVCRIQDDAVQPRHLTVPGFRKDYVARWKIVVLRVLSVWLLPMAVLFAGTRWSLSRFTGNFNLENRRQAVLASLEKRTLAVIVDIVTVLLLSWTSWRVYLWCFGLEWPQETNRDLADSLLDLEFDIRFGQWREIVRILHSSQLNWLVLPIDFQSDFFGILIGSVLPVCLAKIYFEGRLGLTPGKWLFGLRTVGKTFHPCGFASTLVRNILFCVDIPLLLTPIPAAMSLMLSDQRQRIGDRIAKTIVINVNNKQLVESN